MLMYAKWIEVYPKWQDHLQIDRRILLGSASLGSMSGDSWTTDTVYPVRPDSAPRDHHNTLSDKLDTDHPILISSDGDVLDQMGHLKWCPCRWVTIKRLSIGTIVTAHCKIHFCFLSILQVYKKGISHCPQYSHSPIISGRSLGIFN